MSVYEILCTILKHPGCSYERLEEETGLSYSTVTYHVGRLAKKGILHRLRGAIAFIDFTSKDLRNRVETALRGLYPGGTDTEESHQQPEKQQTTSIQNKEISGDNTISVAESSYSPDEVARQLQQGTLSPDNLLIKEPPPDQSS
jgi:DNA-binding Lrp family transcriptional regulator